MKIYRKSSLLKKSEPLEMLLLTQQKLGLLQKTYRTWENFGVEKISEFGE